MRLAVWALLLLALPAAAADVVIPIESVSQHVNVRMEADPKSEIVGRLRAGGSLPFKRTVPGWHEVELADEAYGYVSEDWSLVISEEDFAKRLESAASEESLAASQPDDATADVTNVEVDASVAEASVEDVADPQPEEVASDDALADAVAAPVEAAVEEVAEAVAEEVTEEVTDEPAEAMPSDETPAETMAEAVEDVSDEPAPEPIAAAAVQVEDEDAAEPVAEQAAETGPAPTVAVVPTIIEGPAGPQGPPGPPGPTGSSTVEGTTDYVMKFTASTIGGNSQIFDNGRNVGIGTNDPKQRLEVNGNIQIHEQNSNVAGLMLTQASGETGYIMHNRANTLTLGSGSVDRMSIDGDGNVGIGVARPSHPIEMASGAYVSAGGVWTNSSSRARKENISELTPEEALAALVRLEPVRFNYIRDDAEEYVGFIAEDVPDLVASSDRESLSTMDIVAVLTKVVQQQQHQIEDLEARLDRQTAAR